MKNRLLWLAIPFHLVILALWARSAFYSDHVEFMPLRAPALIVVNSSFGNLFFGFVLADSSYTFEAAETGLLVESDRHPFRPMAWFSPFIWQSEPIKEIKLTFPYWSLIILFWLPRIWQFIRQKQIANSSRV